MTLDRLVKNTKNFYHLESEINSNNNLVKNKGVYPYDYMDSRDRFNETQLPHQSLLFSKLINEHICDAKYKHAKNIWVTFNIQNLGEYHDLYLKTGVLFIADVFKNYRNSCLDYYKLDPAHYFSASGLFCDTALKNSRVTLKLFTDPDIHLFVEEGLRSGISVRCNRYRKQIIIM